MHETAIIHPNARLANDVQVGPWTTIGADVEIGAGTRIGSHCVIEGSTVIGRDNHIHPFNTLGGTPQDKKYQGEKTQLIIGNSNVIREYCTFNCGTVQGGGKTVVGDSNWIMAYVHIAHDCLLGDDIIFANGTSLAGHVQVEDHVTLGGFTLIHQFCMIGAYSFSAADTLITKDVPPYVTVAGGSAKPYGINSEGMRRRGFSVDAIEQLRRAYKIIYRQGYPVEKALQELEAMATAGDGVQLFIDFLRRSTRGIIR